MGNRRSFMLQALGSAAMVVAPRWVGAFVHPIDEPAVRSDGAARRPMVAVGRAGKRFVAVGFRGQIVISDDGRKWTQASVPVSSDLVAVSFATETSGWAVGHGGIILKTVDGGASWTTQLDGRQAAKVTLAHYERLLAEGAVSEQFLAEERSLLESEGTQPFLDVQFVNEMTGFVVGTFNRIFRTDDGGMTWLPWMDRTDNPGGLHFNAIAGHEEKVYLAGEQGTVWRLDRASGRFETVSTGYAGTLFGVLPVSARVLVVFGMRGSVFRTDDAGVTWEQIKVGSQAGVTSGTVMSDGAIVLVTQAGGLEVSRDQGRSFESLVPSQAMPYYGVSAAESGQLILAGAEGMRVEMVR